MHEAIGRKQFHGRVNLGVFQNKEHYYGIGALEGLKVEITIFNGSQLPRL